MGSSSFKDSVALCTYQGLCRLLDELLLLVLATTSIIALIAKVVDRQARLEQ